MVVCKYLLPYHSLRNGLFIICAYQCRNRDLPVTHSYLYRPLLHDTYRHPWDIDSAQLSTMFSNSLQVLKNWQTAQRLSAGVTVATAESPVDLAGLQPTVDG